MDFSPWDPSFANLMASGRAAPGPSAIQQLLAHLTGQGAAPSPSATPTGASDGQGPAMPPSGGPAPQVQIGNMTAPAPQAPPLNIPDPRMVESQQGVGFGNKIRNLLSGGAPVGYNNLLSPQEIEQAKPGIFESLMSDIIGGPLASRMLYRQNLGNAVGMDQLAANVQANRAGMQERARQLAATQRMAQLFPEGPNETLDQMRMRLGRMYNYAVANGLTDVTKDIGARMNDVFKDAQPRVVGNALVGPQGQVLYTGEPRHQGTAQTYVSPDGQQYKAVFADETPPKGWKPVFPPRSAGALGGAMGFGTGGIGMVARQYAAIAGMNNADQAMVPFETAVMQGNANYTGLDYYKGMWSKMYDASGHVDPAVHAAVYAKLNQENPALANYLASAEQWALEDSQLSGRPSDFRTKLDAYISAIGPNAQKSTILQRQDFRRTRLKALGDVEPAMKAMLDRAARLDPSASGASSGIPPAAPSGAMATAPGSAAPSERQRLYDEAADFLRKQRASAAAILQKLGPRPGQ